MDHFLQKLHTMQDTMKEIEERGCSNIEIKVDHTDFTLKEKKVRIWYSSGIIEEFPI